MLLGKQVKVELILKVYLKVQSVKKTAKLYETESYDTDFNLF